MTGLTSAAEPRLHFEREEFAERQRRVRHELAERELDGLLVFKIEDQYWLSGYDSEGYSVFHCAFIGIDGQLTHLTRTADLQNLRYSSLCEDIRIWSDAHGSSKARAIKEMLDSHGMRGKRVGIQLDTLGLTARVYMELRAELEEWCELVDASDLVQTLRLIKSPQELEYHRRAGAIVDEMRDVAIESTEAGAFEGDVMSRVYQIPYLRDGDPPANRPIMGSGASAMNMRYTTGRKDVLPNDQMTFEIGAGYRHYHAASMFVVLTGPEIDDRHLRMHEACVEALAAVQEAIVPGATLGELFELHRASFASKGYERAILNACGYTMGAVWPPLWIEPTFLAAGNPLVLQPDMTFFTHMILVDLGSGLTMSLGEQAIVTEGAPEIITHVPREPIIR